MEQAIERTEPVEVKFHEKQVAVALGILLIGCRLRLCLWVDEDCNFALSARQ